MNQRRLFSIAARIVFANDGKASIFDAVNKALAEAHNVDHVRSILGQHKVKLFKEPPYPNDIPKNDDDLETGIESVNEVPLDGLHFLRKAEHGWEISGASL